MRHIWGCFLEALVHHASVESGLGEMWKKSARKLMRQEDWEARESIK